MSISRTTGLGIGAAAVVLVLFIALIAALSGGGSGPEAAARAFFAANAQKGPQAAWSMTSPAFQQAVGAQQWAEISASRNLSQYASSTWTRQGSGEVATLSGVVTLNGGAAEPAEAKLVKSANGWSLFSLDMPQGGVAGAAPASPDQTANGQSSYGQSSYGQASGGQSTEPAPPNGLPPNGLPPAGAAPNAQQTGATGYPPSSSAATPGQTAQAAPTAVTTLSRTRVAKICGGYVLKQPNVQTVSVHCPDDLSTTPGAKTRCLIKVNGFSQTVVATLRSYNAQTNIADLDCQPGPPE